MSFTRKERVAIRLSLASVAVIVLGSIVSPLTGTVFAIFLFSAATL